MNGSVILRVDAAMRGNKVIYWLSRLPLIRRLVSDTLYSAKEGKLALSIVLWISRAMRALGGKFVYLGLMCVLPLLILGPSPAEFFGTFCWLLFFLSFVAGALLNTCAMEPSQLKHTCVRMMGMDAARYHLWAELKHHVVYFVTFTIALSVGSLLFHRPVWLFLLLSLEMACARLIWEWFHVWAYSKSKKGQPLWGRTWFNLTVMLVSAVAAYVPGLIFAPNFDRILLSPWVAAVLLIGAVLSVISLIRYPNYYRLTLDTCQNDKLSAELQQQKAGAATFQDVQLKDSDFTAEDECSNLTGWNYFQALFFRRHRRMMYKPLRICLFILTVITVLLCGLFLFLRNGEIAELFNSVTRVLPYCVFFLYIIQSNIVGARITRAMFYNCDLAMLKFGWYRKGDVVLKNFLLRFGRLCGVNLLLSGAVCVMFTLLTLCAGGRPPLMQYLAFMAALLCLGIFFAVHSLGMYYLFQPYTSDLKVKNPFFNLLNGIMYVVCYTCIQIRSTPTWFTLVVLIVTVVYSAVILFFVWKRSPKTFRVK